MVVTYVMPVSLCDGREVEVTVRAEVRPPKLSSFRLDPNDSDPGDPGEFSVLSVIRNDTGEDVLEVVDPNQMPSLEESGFAQAGYESECAYETAMEARADAAREQEWE